MGFQATFEGALEGKWHGKAMSHIPSPFIPKTEWELSKTLHPVMVVVEWG
jgi:hypothetical protein